MVQQVISHFVSTGCNRHVDAADWLEDGSIVYAAYKSIAIYTPQDPTIVLVTLHGHDGIVNVVKQVHLTERCAAGYTASDDGHAISQAFLSGAQDGSAILWGLVVGHWRQLARFCHGAPIVCMAADGLSTGQDVLALGGSDGSLSIWSMRESQRPIQKIDLTPVLPLSLAISPLPGTCQCLIALALTNSQIRLLAWDATTARTVYELKGHEDWVRSLDFTLARSEDRQAQEKADTILLASGSHDKYIRIWKIALLNDDIHIGSNGYQSTDEVGDCDSALASGTLQEMATDYLGATHGFTISDSSQPVKYVVTFEALLIGHDDKVFSVKWHPTLSGQTSHSQSTMCLLSASADKSMIVWAPESTDSRGNDQDVFEPTVWVPLARLGEIGGTNLGFYGALWNPWGLSVAAHGHRGSWHLWERQTSDIQQWKAVPSVQGHSKAVQDIVWEPQGQFLISTSLDQTTRVWCPNMPDYKSPTWIEASRPQIHGYNIQSISMIDSLTLLSGADEKVLRVFAMPRIVHDSLGRVGLNFSSDTQRDYQAATLPALGLSNRAITASKDDSVKHTEADVLTEPPDLEDRIELPLTEEDIIRMTLWPEIEKLYGHGDEILATAVSHDGRWIASSCRAHTAEHAVIRLHDTKTWQEIESPLKGHNLSITRCLFSHDDQWLLSVSRDRYWCLYQATGRSKDPYNLVDRNRTHSRIIWDAVFFPDNLTFATASRDKTIRVWKIHAQGDDRAPSDHPRTPLATIDLQDSVTAIDATWLDSDHEGAGTPDPQLLLIAGLESGIIKILGSPDRGQTWQVLLTLAGHARHVDAVRRIQIRPRKIDEPIVFASCGVDSSVRIHQIL